MKSFLKFLKFLDHCDSMSQSYCDFAQHFNAMPLVDQYFQHIIFDRLKVFFTIDDKENCVTDTPKQMVENTFIHGYVPKGDMKNLQFRGSVYIWRYDEQDFGLFCLQFMTILE